MDAGVILLVTRIWDAVSDPMMGIIADCTDTRWGKYRPYLLWMAPLFSVCGILLFTTPDLGYAAKLVWAYTTYLLMMTVYTGINVPYGAMLGVMTADSREKTVFSSFRMFFAYEGSFLAMLLWEPLTNMFGGYHSSRGWLFAMVVVAVCCLVLFLLCFSLTREHLHTVSKASVGADLKSLLHNRPWWILIVAALSFNLFCTVRGATVAYYFNDLVGMSPSSFSRFFKLRTSKTLSEYMVDIRLGVAARKLVDTTESVSEICYACGFNTLSNFNRLFRKHKGCNPSEFRDKYHKTRNIF